MDDDGYNSAPETPTNLLAVREILQGEEGNVVQHLNRIDEYLKVDENGEDQRQQAPNDNDEDLHMDIDQNEESDEAIIRPRLSGRLVMFKVVSFVSQ